MKNYSFYGNTHWNAYRDYIVELDNNIWSLYDYIYTFNPNYRILNYSLPVLVDDKWIATDYYDEEELVSLGLIETIEQDSIIAHINHLPKHMGLLNNFSSYKKDQRFYTDESGQKWKWPEASIIIAKSKPTLPLSDAYWNRSISNSNYLIARLSAGADFYVPIKTDSDKLTWAIDYQAEEKYGLTWITTIAATQPRYIASITTFALQKEQHQHTFLQTNIQSLTKTYWATGWLLNHELYYTDAKTPNASDYEEVICDDVYEENTFTNIDKTKNLGYTITIKTQEQIPESIKVQLW